MNWHNVLMIGIGLNLAVIIFSFTTAAGRLAHARQLQKQATAQARIALHNIHGDLAYQSLRLDRIQHDRGRA